MNKLITTLIVGIAAVGAFAQGGIRVGPPRSEAPDPVRSQSLSVTYDTSLLKALVLFDGLDNSYMALNYEVGQVDGLLNNPLRLGVAAAHKGGKEYWAGPSITYNFLNSDRVTVGLVGALPGVTFSGNSVDFGTNARLIPGVSVSVRW
jgi:hypothetical protein